MIDELIMLGRTVIYCGIVPTPTVQYMVHISEAVGGFIITASHNPIEWNGIKFLREDSTFFHKSDCEKLFNLADNFNAPATYADRLAVVDENGTPLGEEYSLVLAADGYINFLKVEKETFVSNLSTSLALDKLASSKKCQVIRSAVGEINVVNKMNELGANLGGEGNGGVILRECHLGRDSLVAVTMVLNRMAQSENKLSVIHQGLPQYKIVKDKVLIEGVNVEEFLDRVDSIFQDGEKNTIDGLKITWDDKWVHLRGSNTEPIIRIYAEALSEEIATQLIKKVKDQISVS